MFQGYIFDLDGVIVDTAKYHYTAWRRLANKIGFDITEEQNENLKGVSRKESLEYILTLGEHNIDDSELPKLAALKNQWYVELISDLDQSEILPGVLNFLGELQSARKNIALGSASKNSVRILTGLDIISYFEVVIDGNKTTKSKPHPQVFNMGAEALGLINSQCVVFEDSINGVKAANDGGFTSVGVGEQSVLHEADVVLPGLKDVTIQSLDELCARGN